MKYTVTRLSIVYAAFAAVSGFQVAYGSGSLETYSQYSRIKIALKPGIKFQLIQENSKVSKIVIEGMSPQEYGNLQGMSDQRVRSIQVKTNSDTKGQISLQLSEGSVRAFAYANPQATELTVDLWNGDEKKENLHASSELPKFAKGKKTKILAIESARGQIVKAQPSSRGLASQTDLIDEYKRKARLIEVLPLSRDRDVFEPFPLRMPELVMDTGLKEFSIPPTENFEDQLKFIPGDKNEEDGAAYEMARRLYKAKKYGLAIKTIEITNREHPKTKYDHYLKLLEAICYLKLAKATNTPSLLQKGEATLSFLAAYLDSNGHHLPFDLAIHTYFGTKAYNAGLWLDALKNYEYVNASMRPENPIYPYLNMLMADLYIEVGQIRRAERILRFLRERFPKHPVAGESAYRAVDLLSQEKTFSRVNEMMVEALKNYPNYEKIRPEATFNNAEAYFWLKNYSQAEKYFKRYMEINGSHSNGGLALVRLGEIAEIQHGNLEKAKQYYLEAINHYPFSLGFRLATVRLGRININDETNDSYVLDQLKDQWKTKELSTNRSIMMELVLTKYLRKTGNYDQAIEIARKGMSGPEGPAYEGYKIEFIQTLYRKLVALYESKEYGAAIDLYEKEKMFLEAYGPATFLIVSNVYNEIGLHGVSNDFYKKFLDSKSKEDSQATVATKSAKQGRKIASESSDVEMNIILAQNHFANGEYEEAIKMLPAGENYPKLYIRAIAKYRLNEKKLAYESAEKALKKLKTNPELIKADEVDELVIVMGDKFQEERNFRQMEELVKSAQNLVKEDRDVLDFMLADALWYQKKHKEAIQAYKAALEAFPKSSRLERSKYNLSISLMNLGNRDEAVKFLTELSEVPSGIWSESAKRELDLIQWEKKYSSILKTLPPTGIGVVK